MSYLSVPGASEKIREMAITNIVSGYTILTGFDAKNLPGDIAEAELRLMFVDVTDRIPAFVDLRTPGEGGTFVDNGTTQRIITGLAADTFGAQYKFTSANPGRWFIAWRFRGTSSGYSNWSDGNKSPSAVYDYADTNIDSTEDTAPPATWTVSLISGPMPNTVQVKITKPESYANIIRGLIIQIADGDTVTWRLLDAAAGAAATYYDGSAIAHALGGGGKTVTRTAGAGFGTAQVGDLCCLDVRGGAFDIQNCNLAVITEFEGNNPATATWFKVDMDLEPQTLADLRVKIVKAPWLWGAADGYLGTEANRGVLNRFVPGARKLSGSRMPAVYYSDPIEIPAAVTNPEARVWIRNGFSTSDNAAEHSTGIVSGPGIIEPGDYSDFTNTNDWLLVNTAGGDAGYAINADKSITLRGLTAHGTYQLFNNFVGVVSRNSFFPDLSTGILQVACTFTNWVQPTDFVTVGKEWLFGIAVNSPGPSGGFQGSTGFAVAGGRMTLAAPQTWEFRQYSFVSRGNFTGVTNSPAGTIAAGASCTIRITIGPRTLAAGTTRSIGITNINITGAGGFGPTWNVNNPGGDADGATWNDVFHLFGGFRIAIGLWPRYLSTLGRFTISGFSLLSGFAVSDSVGAELGQQAQYFGPGAPAYTPNYTPFVWYYG